MAGEGRRDQHLAAGEAPEVPEEGAALKPLPRIFYRRPSPVVAPDLLGRVLVRRLEDGQVLAGRIVECEAYQEDDPASHSYRGRTVRTEVMFGPPGHLYVYRSYGVHWCCNVVTGQDGEGSAVLLRAVEPLEGIERMRELRGGMADGRLLCAGPGRLTQALAIGPEHNGVDVVAGGDVWLAGGRPRADEDIEIGPRVGITVARDLSWRFTERGSVFVSRSRPGTSQGA